MSEKKYQVHVTLWEVDQVDEETEDFDLLEENEIIGLKDEYVTKEEAFAAYNSVAKGSKVADIAWIRAKAGWQQIKTWAAEQKKIDGDLVQVGEILYEWLKEIQPEQEKKIIVVYDEGRADSPLHQVQVEGIQPAYIYGDGPWVVSNQPLSNAEFKMALDSEDNEE